MIEEINLLKNKFYTIKNLGWVKSLRKGSTGIGYTFESLLGKKEDTLTLPDFNGIEIKSHRKNSKSYITLFNYNPIGESSYELKRIFNIIVLNIKIQRFYMLIYIASMLAM